MFRSAKLFVAGLSLTTMVFAAPSLVRAADGGDKPAKKEGGQRGGGDRSKMLTDALASLNLTDDQKKKVDPIVEKLKTDLKTLMDDKSVDQDAKRTKGKEILTTAWTDIESNLTADQKTALEKYRDEHKPAGKKGGDGAKKGGGDKPAN